MATRIPINKDNYNFEDRQKRIWEDMERDMERRRREWENEIGKMRQEFFHSTPENSEFAGREGALSRLPTHAPSRPSEIEDGKAVIEKDDQGQPTFKVRFNMKDYKPEEMNVKMDSSKIMVTARHEKRDGGSTVSREYSREVNIPREVDPLALQCTLNPDGFLVVHAPLPAPSYNVIKDSAAATQSPGILKSAPSYQSSKPQSVHITAQPSTLSQQQVHTHTINQQHAPLNSNKPTVSFSQSTINKEESSRDHVVPTFKPPPDFSKLDMPDSATAHSSGPSMQASHIQSSIFPKPPPFSTLSSTFPSGSIFPDSSSQAQLSAPVITSHDGKFQLTMPINDYKPHELTVKTQDRKVIICARREVTSGNRAQTMEMNREHSLPDNVDPLTVKAFFTDTDKLIIEAPFITS